LWTTMGAIKKGDPIMGVCNKVQKVLDVFDKGERQVYKVFFSDGSVVECSGDHLWQVYFSDRLSKVISFDEIIDIFEKKEDTVSVPKPSGHLVDIVKIEKGEVEEVRCIKVSNPDSLYITDDNIVTHNTTTATVLAQAIVSNSQEQLEKHNAITIKRGIDCATKEVVRLLKDFSQPTNTAKRRREIAEISANGEKEISKLVVEALNKVGKDGIIKVEEAETTKSFVDVVKGYQFDSPISNWKWITNHEKLTAEFSDMHVLLFEGFIEEFTQVIPVIKSIQKEDGTLDGGLLIIADNLDPQAENRLLDLKTQGYKILYVKSPSFGTRRTETLRDIASLINAKVYTNLQDFKGGLGKIKKVEVDVNNTLLVGGEGDITERLSVVKNQLKTIKGTKKDKEYVKERIGKLTGGVAVINIGGYSEVERREKTDRVDDALKAVLCSLEEGYVAGGGVTFLQIAKLLDSFEVDTPNRIGVEIIQKSLRAPFLQIYKNAEIKVEDKTEYLETAEYGTGIDIETGEYVNFFETGVIDPTKVSRVAIENASSIASTFLSNGAVVYNSDPIIRA